MRFTHQYDGRGNHRLVAEDTQSVFPPPHNHHEGEWADYRSPAMLHTHRGSWFAVTDYFSGHQKLQADTAYSFRAHAVAKTAEVVPS